ncbi:MAG: OmpA family protein [Lewinellaceae bacterium]|nr:OmpA family protein [Lewinellaceae bacterium]
MKTFVTVLLHTLLPFLLLAQGEAAHPLPFQLNTGYDESWPVVSPEGRAIYFTRLGHPQNMGEEDEHDIWVSYRAPGGQWAKAVNLGAPANSRAGEAVVGISATGRRLYLYKPATGSLSYTERKGRSWLMLQPLPVEHIGLNGTQACLYVHHDGRVMMVSMERPDGLGQHDLYVSLMGVSGVWEPLQHLGPVANSPADELGVFLAADGRSLYFSSDRPGGMGGQDLYYTRRLDDSWSNWSAPENLGDGINTSGDDIFLSMPASGDAVYLARATADGQLDLFEASLPEALRPEPMVLVTGQVREAVSGKALDALVRPYEAEGLHSEEHPGPQGDFQFVIPAGQPIGLVAELPGYFSVAETGPAGQASEALDYDNPVLLASVGNDVSYLQRNIEIEQLQLHLRALDDELITLRQERKAYQASLKKLPANLPGLEPVSDPELDALRHRYEQYTQINRDTVKVPAPETDNGPSSSKQELESLKARYQRYQDQQASQQQAEQVKKAEEGLLWDEAKGFDDVREEVEKGLVETMAPVITQELSSQMLEDVKQEVAQSLSQRERRQIELKEEAMRQEIRRNFSASPSPQWAAKGGAAGTAWEQKLRGDLKAAVEPEVRTLLEEEMRDDIRAALRNDLTYWAKKETQAELQAELDQKLQQQIEVERSRPRPAPPHRQEEAVAPLAPPAPASYREVRQDLLLIPAEVGQLIPLSQVVFEPNKAAFLPSAYPELKRVVAFLEQNPALVVEVAAHTGAQLSHGLALGLSLQRAKAVANYLYGNGIDEQRVTFKGYGKSVPLSGNDSPEGQRMNQRIELRIIDK